MCTRWYRWFRNKTSFSCWRLTYDVLQTVSTIKYSKNQWLQLFFIECFDRMSFPRNINGWRSLLCTDFVFQKNTSKTQNFEWISDLFSHLSMPMHLVRNGNPAIYTYVMKCVYNLRRLQPSVCESKAYT